MILLRLLCIACTVLFAAGTIALQISWLVSTAFFLATVACFVSACLVKTK
jgi:hypothetical protein